MTPLFARKRTGDHLGDAKMSKKAPLFDELNFLRTAVDENGFRRMKEGGQIDKNCLKIFNFSWALKYNLSKFSDDFTRLVRLRKTITKSLGKN